MADVFDQATEVEERNRQLSMKVRRPEGPAPTGYCLNCGPDAPLDGGRRFCTADCRDDWQRRQKN